MNITDYLVIAAVIISAGIGSYRGFLREAVALATWFIALFVACGLAAFGFLLAQPAAWGQGGGGGDGALPDADTGLLHQHADGHPHRDRDQYPHRHAD